MEGNGGIYIVSFLRYIQGKSWEGSEIHEEVATFDNLSPQLDHIKNLHPCFFIVFTTFPDFFLDIVQETYNMDHSLAFNEKRSPFRSVCFVIRLLLLYVDASGHEGSNGVGDILAFG